jgi:hypothetical protein
MDFKTEIIKSIQTMIDRKLDNYKTDRTYRSVIKSITPKGYVIIDETGSERTVQCCIPGVSLKTGDSVLVKIPNGNLQQIHIAGINGKTKAAITATQIGSLTVGGTAKPIYSKNGTLTSCSSTVGSTSVPVYMNAGSITACNSSMITYSENEPIELSTGITWIDV